VRFCQSGRQAREFCSYTRGIAVATFAVAARYWPRSAFCWIILLICATILGSIIAGAINYKISLTVLPNSLAFRNFLSAPMQVLWRCLGHPFDRARQGASPRRTHRPVVIPR
jgi:hypothetical protein